MPHPCIPSPGESGATAAFAIHCNGEEEAAGAAVLLGDEICLTLSVPRRFAVQTVTVQWQNAHTDERKESVLRWEALRFDRELYRARFPAGPFFGERSLWFWHPVLDTPTGEYLGVADGYGGLLLSPRGEARPYTLQLTVSDFTTPPPVWMQGGILYQILVDRFAPGGDPPRRADAVYNADWEGGIPEYPAYRGAPLANRTFFGGTLDGVCTHLDYLQGLGVSCLYLCPIFESPSNHKYDTGDYARVDEGFGGEEALRRLLGEAGKRGIRILLDGVFNHTGADSLYFNRYGRYPTVGAYQSTASPYADWYRFRRFPDEYECWWDIAILPKLNLQNPACRSYFLGEDGIVAKYAAMGIGGMRLDVADELPDDFIAGVKARLREHVPDAILYGEVWEDASRKVAYGIRKRYYLGTELDGVMNYPLRTGLIAFFTDRGEGELRYALTTVLSHMPKRVRDVQMNFLGTHDTERILTVLGGEEAGERSMDELASARMTAAERAHGMRRLRLAYLALATLPGVPMIYYGDEAGLEGYGDPFNRRPFPWQHMHRGLLASFRAIGTLRRREQVYRAGDFRLLVLERGLLIFLRTTGDEYLLTAINTSPSPVTLALNGTWSVRYGRARRGQTFRLEDMAGLVLKHKHSGGEKLTLTVRREDIGQSK